MSDLAVPRRTELLDEDFASPILIVVNQIALEDAPGPPSVEKRKNHPRHVESVGS